MIADLVDHFLGGGSSDVRLRAGAEALRHLGAHLHDALRLRHRERLRVGIGDDEVDALQSGGDHVVDRIAAGAADAEHGDPRLQLADVRGSKIECHGCLSIRARCFTMPQGRWPKAWMEVEDQETGSSEALAKPSSDLSEITVSPCPQELPRMPRFDMFKMSVLRIEQQARGHREGCAPRLAGQPCKTERAADAYRPRQDPA